WTRHSGRASRGTASSRAAPWITRSRTDCSRPPREPPACLNSRPAARSAARPDGEAEKGHAADAPLGDDVERPLRERVEPSIERLVLVALFEREVGDVPGALEGADGLDQRAVRQQFRPHRRTPRIDPQAAAVE